MDIPDGQRKYLASTQQAAESLLHLLNDILDFSKIEAGQLEIYEKPFSVDELLESVVNIFEIEADKKGLVLSLMNNVPLADNSLIGDDLRVRQILINLVGNAIKFTEAGQVIITVDVITDSCSEVSLRFKVTDSGMAVPMEFRGQLFDSFSQADSSMSRNFGGSGLGLAICKKLIELMGGEIWIDKEVRQGSIFCFTCSFARTTIDESCSVTSGSPLQQSAKLALNVLLVEDNQFNLDLARIVLEKEGHQVEIAVNGIEALKRLHNGFDVVLMDVQMPEMDGVEATGLIGLCEAGRAAEATEHQDILLNLQGSIMGGHIPIVAMTAHAMSGDRTRCLEAGMDEYITKPFQPEHVFATISHVVDTAK